MDFLDKLVEENKDITDKISKLTDRTDEILMSHRYEEWTKEANEEYKMLHQQKKCDAII
ncbi:MAG: hypothetical protein LBF97_08510 [Elusimicrobiota bacterium]|jgi:hypothetical protein|nr:hypothetical protein [Elusimicrobiota bacterium]